MFSEVALLALQDMRAKSTKEEYRTNPEKFVWEVLGKRWYSRQREIAEAFVSGKRVAVKSGNGVGKSAIVADLITWVVATHDPAETLCIVTAPTLSQIEKVIFAYLKANKVLAGSRGFVLPGRITETLAWKLDGVEGSDFLVFGKRPADRDIVSSFQGTRKKRTFVFMDEAGGLPQEMFTAAEAVATGEGAKILAIGNPDHLGTEFYRIFTDERLSADWVTLTINVLDLPTFTGERVYEDESAQLGMLAGLTSVEWVEHKRRAWGEDSARFKAKVLGEFPDAADNTFFGQDAIDAGVGAVLDGVGPVVLGVDVARFGEDESVVYVNRGGVCRLLDVWGKADTLVSARRVHGLALGEGAVEVRVDASGIGGAVFDMLEGLEEFQPRPYKLIGVDGGARSPDSAQWSNMRAYNHDCLRRGLLEGRVGIDYEDRELRDQLLMVSYRFNLRGAVQITPKDELRGVMGGSPDRLDALIYAVTDLGGALVERPDVVRPGDRVVFEPDELLGLDVNGSGMPW